MKLSTKGRYAVTALADIALHARGGADDGEDARGRRLVPLADIAERQNISLPYLEQLFARLRRAGLVASARGPGGGYRLTSAPAELRVSEIMAAVDETLRATRCSGGVGDGCGETQEACLTHDLWEQLSAQVYLFLHGVTLADIVDKRLTPCNALPNFAALLEEDGIEGAGAARPASGGER
ncbi:MAG: Rrf2 family transcriptional regulator [Pseudomonadota bacterium]